MITIFIYQLFIIWLAYKNAAITGPDKTPKYFWCGLMHCGVAAITWYFYGWKLAVANLLFTRVISDVALNVFRKNSLGHILPVPESKVDKIEKWIVLRISEWIYRNKRNVSDNHIEWVAIGLRLILLKTAILLCIL